MNDPVSAPAASETGRNIDVEELRHLLLRHGVSVVRSRLLARLRSMGYLDESQRRYNLPTPKGFESGFFEEARVTLYQARHRAEGSNIPVVTPAGQAHLVERFMKAARPRTKPVPRG